MSQYFQKMSEKIILEDNISYYKNVINNPKFIIEKLEESDQQSGEYSPITQWKDWMSSDNKFLYGKFREGYYYNRSVTSDYDQSMLEIRDVFENAIKDCMADYSLDHQINAGISDQFRINKYFEGKGMGPHVDNFFDEDKEVGTNLALSLVIYLNDDCEGGEIEFKEQGIILKPEAGSMIIFPSKKPYFHESKPVTKGFKYMSTGFWYK